VRKSYFITAIDTDAGKSIVTGLMARHLIGRGVRVITQKMAQTGCTGSSEDVETHRRIMGTEPFPEDAQGLTCPYIFPFPASPQCSSGLAGEKIEWEKIRRATEALEERYDCVLTEGVGGVMVPLANDRTVLDYLTHYPPPVVLVTCGRLGSVNHTLLSLEALKSRGIEVIGMVYNDFIATDPLITADSYDTLCRYFSRYYPAGVPVRVGRWADGDETPDFSALFGL
jgi:dethiobiotin synthetase